MTQQSTLCDDDNNNDDVDDDKNTDNDEEIANDKDRACGQCRKDAHSCDKDVARLGEIALPTMISEAQRDPACNDNVQCSKKNNTTINLM